jgi:hypothetical protein
MDVTAILLSNVRNGELNFNSERRGCNDLFGFDPAPQCYKILVVQYKYGESGQVQTWFSKSVVDEPYQCFLPASPPPLPVRIVLPDGTFLKKKKPASVRGFKLGVEEAEAEIAEVEVVSVRTPEQRDAAGRKRAIDLDADTVTTPSQRVRAAHDDAHLTTRVTKAHSRMQPQVDAAYLALLQPHFSAYAADEIDAAELDRRKQRAHDEAASQHQPALSLNRAHSTYESVNESASRAAAAAYEAYEAAAAAAAAAKSSLESELRAIEGP